VLYRRPMPNPTLVESMLRIFAARATAELERRRADEALRASESRFRNLVESSGEWIWEMDARQRITYSSPRVRDLLGYEPDEVLGRTPFDFTPPEEHERLRQALAERQEDPTAVRTFETVATRKDGRRVNLESSAVLIGDAQDEVMGLRGATRDVTERSRFEQQREQLIYADKLITLGALVGEVAHEINNPTGSLMLHSDVLQQLIKDLSPALDRLAHQGDGEQIRDLQVCLKDVVEGVVRSTARIRDIVADLKGFSTRSPVGAQESVDLNEVVQTVLRLMRVRIRRAARQFVLELGPDVPRIRGSAGRLQQVVTNLLENALQALTDPAQEIRIGTGWRAASREVFVEVSDKGVGIPADVLPRVTEAFFTTRPETGSIGIGLAVASRIVHEHGGQLAIRSEPGQGTTVTVLLPTGVEAQVGGEKK